MLKSFINGLLGVAWFISDRQRPQTQAAIQCSRYPLATSPMAIIWPIGRLKLVSGETFDYKLQPKINVTDALFPRINS